VVEDVVYTHQNVRAPGVRDSVALAEHEPVGHAETGTHKYPLGIASLVVLVV